MRYDEPKNRSAELLRLSLGHMGQHDAAFNPITFTVWYEHLAGTNARLSAALEQLLTLEPRLVDNHMVALFKAHIQDPDATEVQRLSGEFQRLMTGMAESAASTGNAAGAFGEQLDGLAQALTAQDGSDLSPRLRETLAGTVQMQGSALALQVRVRASEQEISRLHVELQRARDEALHDPLTKILNRKGFDLRIEDMLANRAAPHAPGCLILLDIDHFKHVNDKHGHLTGDRVIQGLGEILRVEAGAGNPAVARHGGEEFAVVLPGTPLEDARLLAERILARTRALKLRHRETKEVMLTVTVSAGVAQVQGDDDASSLIARADAALYTSKQAGRDRVTCARSEPRHGAAQAGAAAVSARR
jgi:diguanylate cyclase